MQWESYLKCRSVHCTRETLYYKQEIGSIVWREKHLKSRFLIGALLKLDDVK